MPPGFLGALSPSDAIATDTAKAKQYAAHSGIKNPTITLSYVTGTSALTPVLASRVQSSLGQIGITVTLNPQSSIVGVQNYRGGQDQMGLFGWAPDYPDPNDYLAFVPGGTVGLRAGWPAAPRRRWPLRRQRPAPWAQTARGARASSRCSVS